MSALKTWISAFRLRTLPLALSSVSLGIALAAISGNIHFTTATLCLVTAVLLQILSNLANDYGDFVKGTDNANRIGNMRALQSGQITRQQMYRMITLIVSLCLISGIWLLLEATHGDINYAFLLFLFIGLIAIGAAIKYTIGANAYGYHGLGDGAVFLFFGPVAVCGTFIVCRSFEWEGFDPRLLLPAAGMGLLCAAVLNTNNIRDISNDAASGKITIPVKVGLLSARKYHAFLILAGLILFFIYSLIAGSAGLILLQVPATLLIIKNLVNVLRTEPSPEFNRFLKELSIGIMLFTFIYIITLLKATGHTL